MLKKIVFGSFYHLFLGTEIKNFRRDHIWLERLNFSKTYLVLSMSQLQYAIFKGKSKAFVTNFRRDSIRLKRPNLSKTYLYLLSLQLHVFIEDNFSTYCLNTGISLVWKKSFKTRLQKLY